MISFLELPQWSLLLHTSHFIQKVEVKELGNILIVRCYLFPFAGIVLFVLPWHLPWH